MATFGTSITPAGTLNGSNTVFTIPRIACVDEYGAKQVHPARALLLNGVRQRLGIDYTVVDDGVAAGTLTITYTDAPSANATHEVI